MKSHTRQRIDRLEEHLRRAHAARPIPETGEDTVRSVMARVRSLPAHAPGRDQAAAWRERLVRVLYPFAGATALAAVACAVWILSMDQSLDLMVMRVALADPTGLGALRLAGL